jgi:hypothetical protein
LKVYQVGNPLVGDAGAGVHPFLDPAIARQRRIGDLDDQRDVARAGVPIQLNSPAAAMPLF